MKFNIGKNVTYFKLSSTELIYSSVSCEDVNSFAEIEFGEDSNPLHYVDCLYDSDFQVITNVVLDTASIINDSAFINCSSFASVTIGDNVTKIGNGAFANCSILKEVFISKNVVEIPVIDAYGEPNAPFYGCPSDMVIYVGLESESDMPDTWNYGWNATNSNETTFYTIIYDYTASAFKNKDYITIENGVVTGYTGAGGDIVIPTGVTSIARSAFNSETGITSLKISEGVTDVGYYAFYGCTKITKVLLPDSLTIIPY